MGTKDTGRREVRKPKKDKKAKVTGHTLGAVSDLEARQHDKGVTHHHDTAHH